MMDFIRYVIDVYVKLYFMMTAHEMGHMIVAQLYGLRTEFKLSWIALVTQVYGANNLQLVGVAIGGIMPILPAIWIMREETGQDHQEWFIAVSMAFIYSIFEIYWFTIPR
jgi:hypothetical protein